MTKDRIHPEKFEDAASGGTETDEFPTAVDKNEDYYDGRGLTIQGDATNDEKVYVSRDASGNMIFKDDVVTEEKTLTDLLAITPLSTATPTANTAATGTAGVSTDASKADHRHQVTVGSPVAVSTANSNGTSTSLARADHKHAGLTRGAGDWFSFSEKALPLAADSILIEDVYDGGAKKYASIGNLPPNPVLATVTSPGVSAAEAEVGTDGSAARTDHTHAVSTGTISAVGTETSNGTEDSLARSDHVHAGLTREDGDFTIFANKDTPIANDIILIEDSEDSDAKKHAHLSALPFVSQTVFNQLDETVADHITNTSNPHAVTAAQVGNTTAQWNADHLQGKDVYATDPTDGQLLTWNTTQGRWEPQDLVAHAATHISTGDDPIDDVVSGGASGLMSGADKSKLDGCGELTDSSPEDTDRSNAVVGDSTTAARSNHKHDIAVDTPTDIGTENAQGDAASLAVSNHVHALPFETVASVLGTEAAANIGWIFKSDGDGSGTMQTATPSIARVLTVGLSGDVGYTSIKTAVEAAVAGGAASATPWEVIVYPGTYTEAAFTLPAGVTLRSSAVTRIDNAFIVAADSTNDLITMTGGCLAGFRLSGVTTVGKALIRCATQYSACVLYGLSFKNCTIGVAVSNGATLIGNQLSIQVTGANQAVTTGVLVTGTGTYCALIGGSFVVPAALLSAYSINPIQEVLSVGDAAKAFVLSSNFDVASKDDTADVLLANEASRFDVVSCNVTNANRAFRIGSTGTGTRINTQACILNNNTVNYQSDSATGIFLVNDTADTTKLDLVSGALLSGILSSTTENQTTLIGELKYQFPTGNEADVTDFIYDYTGTGVCAGGAVTAASGLHVNVARGEGWVRRGTPYYDSTTYTWNAVTDLDLTASTTNYVYYAPSTGLITAGESDPGNAAILLATVVTSGGGIRYLHKTRTYVSQIQNSLQDYFLHTRKFALRSGLTASQGSTTRKFEVASGSYFRTYDQIDYAGSSGDATFSYFYGTNGATEVATQTQLSITQYDGAGTLTAMTSGYYRSDTLYLTSDGRLNVLYGTAQYATEALAEAAPLGNVPTFVEHSGCKIARFLVQENVGIVKIIDERPQPGSSAGSGASGVSVHSALSGLNADDHSQYILASGTRAMSGNLNMGSNAITSVGTVDGVTVSAHAARHAVGGVDALSTGTPVAVGTANGAGSATSFAKSDHVHSGLNRAAGDFNAFTAKTSPGDGDLLLIEDNADSLNKKKATVSSLPFTTDVNHKALRQLIHFIDNGPAEGFASGAYREMTGTVFPTAVIWYDKATSGKKKIVEKLITWTGVNPTTIVWKIYDAAETLLATVTDTISYSGVFETSRTRTIA